MKKFLKRSFEDKRIRFLFVGVLNTIFGYAVYALFIYLGLHYFMAQLFGSFLAVAHSYLWNKYFTFKSPDHSYREMARFVTVYALSYLLNMLMLYVVIEKLKISAYIAGLISLFVTTMISYIGHKSFSFKKTK